MEGGDHSFTHNAHHCLICMLVSCLNLIIVPNMLNGVNLFIKWKVIFSALICLFTLPMIELTFG